MRAGTPVIGARCAVADARKALPPLSLEHGHGSSFSASPTDKLVTTTCYQGSNVPHRQNSYTEDLLDTLDYFIEECDCLLDGLGVPQHQPSRVSDICERLRECLEGAVLIAPFRAGDRVCLNETPVIDEKTAWGWRFAKEFLVEGALATVRAVKFDSRGFGLMLAFDGEPAESAESRSLFYFSANAVTRVVEGD